MEALRLVAAHPEASYEECSRCREIGAPWDRIAGCPFCPDCQESLAQGTAEPLVVQAERRPCAICGHVGAISYLTYPLGRRQPIEMDLCPNHFRALLGRRLDAHAFHRLRRQLQRLSVSPHNVFLLHEAFYNEKGQALQPALDLD